MAHLYVERRELPDDLRRLLESGVATVEYTPPLDVIETDTAVEILLDVPGVSRAQIEIVYSNNVLVITGEKVAPASGQDDAAFHIAERAFGRFARAIGLDGALDASKAVATLAAGELRIVLPRIQERRGARIRVPIS